MTDYNILLTIAKDYKDRGFYSLAIELFKEVTKYCQNEVLLRNVKLMLADSLRIMKRWDEAIKIYFEIEEYGTIGNIKLYLGETEEALKWYE